MAAVDDSVASLTIYGENLDPDEITLLLGCEPTEVKLHKSMVSWHLESDFPRSAELEEKVVGLLDKVTNDLIVWANLAERYDMRIFCGLFLNTWNEGFALSPDLMARLAERKLRIEVDIYAPVEEVWAGSE